MQPAHAPDYDRWCEGSYEEWLDDHPEPTPEDLKRLRDEEVARLERLGYWNNFDECPF